MGTELDTALDRPEGSDAESLADFVEAAMLATGHPFVSEADLVALFRGDAAAEEEFADEAGEPDPEYTSDASRVNAELAIAEMKARARKAREATPDSRVYPFAAEDAGVKQVAAKHRDVYEFILLLSLENAPFRSSNWRMPATRLFDLVGVEILKAYLGPNSRAVRFGWPPAGDRTEKLVDALDNLADEMGLPARRRISVNPKGKDGGVDVVAWSPFADGRAGFIIVLGQCTVSRDVWIKLADIRERLWSAFLGLGQPAVLALIVPFPVKSEGGDDGYSDWETYHHSTGMLIDRDRIVELLARSEPLSGSDRSKLKRWLAYRRRKIRPSA